MKYLITGGAGFIGINTAEYFLKKGNEVTLLDNFSRKGTDSNADWLKSLFPNVRIVRADVRYDQKILDELAEQVDVVIHLAAQVAVTTSVVNPREDFEINALGSFNVLEAVRKSKNKPILLYSSTNKVYGGMEDVEVHEVDNKHMYKDLLHGVCVSQPLDFHSPYGCSKGTADQYFIDYARIYGLRTVVFRQSCIYGTRQFGIEDQGWVAWFTIATASGKPLTIYGDGKQVRDVLFVEDLAHAYDLAIQHIDKTKGKAYNIGGGMQNHMSLLELIKYLEEFFGKKIVYNFDKWRPGDQPVFICDIARAKRDFGWEPRVSPKDGVFRLAKWVVENKNLFSYAK